MNNEMQRLMEKYREGLLSDAEMETLNALAHKDEVMNAASHRAAGIVRRRTALCGTVAMVCLMVGAGVWMMSPKQEAPLLAEAKVPEVLAEPMVTPSAESSVAENPRVEEKIRPVVTNPVAVKPADIEESLPVEEVKEPVVICNNQCDADSVINDIWKFLSV